MKKQLTKLWKRFLAWLVDETGIDVPGAAPGWKDCRRSSNWDGNNAARRMMNMISPRFSDAKFKEYLAWQKNRGCDHVHILMVNQADGEGAGYDAIGNADHKALALKRVQEIRRNGLGVVAWVVADDSDNYRKKVFADPGRYARSLMDFAPYLSYVVLGLEMDEGEGSLQKWASLRDALVAAGWRGKIATHHTSGRRTYAGLGQIVMDQLAPKKSAADVAASVAGLRRLGFEVCGFEYERHPDRAKAEAALAAGAFGCGNW